MLFRSRLSLARGALYLRATTLSPPRKFHPNTRYVFWILPSPSTYAADMEQGDKAERRPPMTRKLPFEVYSFSWATPPRHGLVWGRGKRSAPWLHRKEDGEPRADLEEKQTRAQRRLSAIAHISYQKREWISIVHLGDTPCTQRRTDV